MTKACPEGRRGQQLLRVALGRKSDGRKKKNGITFRRSLLLCRLSTGAFFALASRGAFQTYVYSGRLWRSLVGRKE